MTIEIRKPLARFVQKMESVLRANDFKGGWSRCSRQMLLDKLHEEVSELDQAMRNHPYDRTTIANEAADVANIAMMIYDNWGPLNEED